MNAQNPLDVLVVENFEPMQELMVRRLECNGFSCRRAANAKDAIRECKMGKPWAIVLDGNLDGSDCFEIIEYLRLIGYEGYLVGVSDDPFTREKQAEGCTHMADKDNAHLLIVELRAQCTPVLVEA